MGIHALDWLSIIVYLLIVAVMAVFFSQFMKGKGAKDFFAGGRQIPWWAAAISLCMGIFSAGNFTGTASDLSIFGPLEVLGFLKLPFGNRMFFIIGVTLAAFLLSRPMGRLGRSHPATIALSISTAVGLWFFFIVVSANKLISWDILLDASGMPSGAMKYFVSMTVGAIAFGYLTYLFCRIYSRDIDKPEPEVDKFFTLLKTPIDVEREVGDNPQTATIYPFIGMIVIGLAVMTLVLLLFPAGRDNPAVNLVLPVILALIGLLIMRGGKSMLRKPNDAKMADSAPLHRYSIQWEKKGMGARISYGSDQGDRGQNLRNFR